jgi:hypothetical protein
VSSPTHLFSFSLILTFAVLFQPHSTCGQSTGAKSKATGSISGRVTLTGKAAAGITVAALAGDIPNRQFIARTITDGEGHYHLFGLAPAQYLITALAPSLAVADQSSYSGSYYGLGKSIVLSAAETVDDVDIKLVRGSVITGRVTDSEGQPVIEQRVDIQIVDQNGNPTRQPQPYFPIIR